MVRVFTGSIEFTGFTGFKENMGELLKKAGFMAGTILG